MIESKDRSGWFGASDTHFVMGNWSTKTFEKWWLVKLGLRTDDYESVEMQTGTAYEHKILESIGITKMDRQIKIRRLKLRVNLDGEDHIIHEVKTYKKTFKVTKAYWQQCQVEMYAAKKGCEIVAYKLLPEDYENWFNPIDPRRISRHPIEYDQRWINEEYLPRLEYLAGCLDRKAFPEAERFAKR